MAYRFRTPEGVEFEADTCEELLRLYSQWRSMGGEEATSWVDASSDEAKWTRFVKLIGDNQVRLLSYMRTRGEDKVTIGELAEGLGLGSNAAAGGTVSGVRKNTTKVGWGVDDVLHMVCATRDRRYQVGPILRLGLALPDDSEAG